MIVLARVGDMMALLAFVFGAGLWRFLSTPQRLTAAFCGVSGALGIAQAAFASVGGNTAVFGNAWDLALLALLCPAIWRCLRSRRRMAARIIWAVAVALWISNILLDGQFGIFEFDVSAGLYLATGAVGALMAYQFALSPYGAMKSPAFIRGATVLGVCTADALVTAILPFPEVFGIRFLILAMAFRNLLWVLAYAAMLRSMVLPERAPRRPAPLPEHPDGHAATFSLS